MFVIPLNCSMTEGITYYTAFPEDSCFGAHLNAIGIRWAGSCAANLKYEPGEVRKSVLSALRLSEDAHTPFMVVIILLVWEDTP